MIISAGRGYIFVHIPKTGGTSLSLALEARAKKDDILIGDTPKAKQRRKRVQGVKTHGRLWKHSTLTDIDGLLSIEDMRAQFCFTLVRNPWNRAVSYYHWLQMQTFDHPSVHLAKSLNFETFLMHPDTLAAFRNSPASSYMRTVDGVEKCDLYIRIEHFQEDVGPLQDHLGFPLRLPHENRSDRKVDYRIYYSDHSAELLGEACAQDISRFGYRF